MLLVRTCVLFHELCADIAKFWRLTADTADEAADDADGQNEQGHEDANSQWRLEELNQRTLEIGLK